MKAVTQAVDWGFSTFELCVDSASVLAWLRSIVIGDKKIRTRGLGELLVRRRLQLLSDVIKNGTSTLHQSSSNPLRTRLRRVPKAPGHSVAAAGAAVSSEEALTERIKEVHDKAHFGVDRTLSLVKMRFPEQLAVFPRRGEARGSKVRPFPFDRPATGQGPEGYSWSGQNLAPSRCGCHSLRGKTLLHVGGLWAESPLHLAATFW